MDTLKAHGPYLHLRPGAYCALWTAVLMLLLCGVKNAQASWFVDPARFHASAHGQTSCEACHFDVTAQALHPDPGEMAEPGEETFSMEQCLYCHDGIMEALQEGSHGSLQVSEPSEYETCIGCHDPHYQIRREDQQADRFDPELPVRKQCGSCHQTRTSLPLFSTEDQACMTCHQSIKGDEPAEIERINRLCFHCHGRSGTRAQAITGQMAPLMDKASHEFTPHTDFACISCHQEATTSKHGKQEPASCSQCHLPHPEKVAHDAHLNVSCQACHLKGIRVVKDAETNRIQWEKAYLPGAQSLIHQMVRFEDETPCQRCHYAGNPLGVGAMVLPPKGIICMPCHTATFSVDDPITVGALVIFCFGLVLYFSVFLSGSLSGKRGGNPFTRLIMVLVNVFKVLFSSKIIPLIQSLFWDVFLQRRLFRQSRIRWVIHALIFYAFIFRFFWGLLALLGSLWQPEWPVVWDMVNKNYPLTALWFDVTGLLLLSGIIFAFIRGTFHRSHRAPGLLEQDRVALGLIGGIVIIGFILEGMRIALTGYPDHAAYGFIGYGIALLFSFPRGLTEVYGFVWYIHAALTGAFIAYIPFSRLLHMIIAPVVLTMNAVSHHREPGGAKTG